MAWRIAQQPNGKFARFSEVVDDFTHMDMTQDEALELCSDFMPLPQAEKKITVAINDAKRFDEAVAIIRAIHGTAICDQRTMLANAAS